MESNLPGAGQGTDKYSKVCPQKKEKQDGKNRRIVAGKVTLQVMNQKAEQEENETACYGKYFFHLDVSSVPSEWYEITLREGYV